MYNVSWQRSIFHANCFSIIIPAPRCRPAEDRDDLSRKLVQILRYRGSMVGVGSDPRTHTHAHRYW